MINEENIKGRLLKLEGYIEDLEDYHGIDVEEYENNKLLKRFIERTLHLAIECCIDIGSHIISEERLGVSDTNSDIMRLLAKNGIIKEKEEQYIKMAKFRNVVVYDYAELDDEIIISILNNNLEDIKKLFFWFREYL